MEFLDQAIKFISENLLASSGVIAVVVEFALRLIKSEKPHSIFLGISAGLKKIAEFALKLSEFLDKIIPQKLK